VTRLLTTLAALALAACSDPAAESAGDADADTDTAPEGPQDWPMTRGGPALQGRVEAPVPRQPEVAWTFTLDSPAYAEAAVLDDTLVIGDLAGILYAIDLETRELKWKFETGDSIEAAAALADGRAFVGSSDRQFYAIDLASGEKQWAIEGGEKFSSAANLIDTGDGTRLLLNGYDGVTRCLDPADGSEIWTYRTEDFINGTPALIDGRYVAFGGCDSVLHILDADSGEPTGEFLTDAQITASVATAGTTIYAGNYANQVVAAELEDESLEWVYESQDFPFFSAPAVDDDHVYIGCRDKSLHAIDRDSGEQAWTFPTGGRVESSPITFDDAVVFGSSDGRLYAVDPKDGTEIWRLDLGENLGAPPVFAGQRLIIAGGGGTLFVIE